MGIYSICILGEIFHRIDAIFPKCFIGLGKNGVAEHTLLRNIEVVGAAYLIYMRVTLQGERVGKTRQFQSLRKDTEDVVVLFHFT